MSCPTGSQPEPEPRWRALLDHLGAVLVVAAFIMLAIWWPS